MPLDPGTVDGEGHAIRADPQAPEDGSSSAQVFFSTTDRFPGPLNRIWMGASRLS